MLSRSDTAGVLFYFQTKTAQLFTEMVTFSVLHLTAREGRQKKDKVMWRIPFVFP